MPTIIKKARRFMEFGPFKAAAETLIEQRNTALKKLEGLKRRREELDALPPHPDDLKAFFTEWVEQHAADYQTELNHRIGQHLTHARTARENIAGRRSQWLGVGLGHRKNYFEDYVQPAAITYFFKDVITATLCKEVDRLDLGECGPPLAEGLKEMDALDREISGIEDDLELLKQAGAEAGIYFR